LGSFLPLVILFIKWLQEELQHDSNDSMRAAVIMDYEMS
jgi:hypothetical protein